MRNVLSIVPKGSWDGWLIIRTAFAQAGAKHVYTQFDDAWEDVHAFSRFPNPAALLPLAGAVLVEQHDEWETRDRGYLSEAGVTELETMNTTKLDPVEEGILVPELAGAWSKH